MKEKKCNLNLVLYEIRNISGNFFVHFFGIVFPILMSLILTKAVGSQVPEAIRPEVVTSIVISMSLVCPMAIILIGYPANYSQEVERGVPLRMRLFGYGEKSVILAKVIAQLVFLTAALGIFGIAEVILIDMQKPALSSLLCLIGCLYLLAVIFFILSHAITNILKKFGPTFAVSMTLYFLIMIVCGMMGVSTEQLPKALRVVADTLPMTYICNDFIDFWQGGSYNFVPLIQSFLFLGAVSGILLLFASYKNKRVIG